jgi:hypothetical protein
MLRGRKPARAGGGVGMSTFRSYSIQCVCRHAFTAELAVAVNVVRMPRLRQAILDGTLHRVTCPACARTFTVEKQFAYVDLDRKFVVHVLPPRESYRWRQVSAELSTALTAFAPLPVVGAAISRRVTFGIGELRDKLVGQDADLDDRHVELAKVLALHEHPILLRRPRLRLFLDKVHNSRLEFFAGYDHAQEAFGVAVPRFAFDRLAAGGVARDWVAAAAHTTNIFEAPDDHWVSIRRWSPSNAVGGTLHAAADKARRGEPIDFDSQDFKVMLSNLPHGSQLASSAKVDLRDVEKAAKSANRADIQQALFQIRFGVELDDEWGLDRETGDIDTLWGLLKDLPDTNVEGNTHLHEIFLKPGDGGGLYNPTSDDIEVSTDPTDGDNFQNVMRHEVGHAVQAKLDGEQGQLVSTYLTMRFGWQSFPGTTAGALSWVEQMEGWDGLADGDRQRVADLLVQALGPGSSWTPPLPPNPPSSDPWWRDNFGPRLAVVGTHEKWYLTNDLWYQKNGRAFFLNYWYREFMVVNAVLLGFINTKMPSTYASMSPGEFFAELYALYYRLDAADRPNIEAADRAWFDANVGAPRVDAPSGGTAGVQRP